MADRGVVHIQIFNSTLVEHEDRKQCVIEQSYRHLLADCQNSA